MTFALETMTEGAWALLLVFLRIGAALMVLPGLGEQVIPARLRLGLAAVLSLVLVPAMADDLNGVPMRFDVFLRALATESIAGLFVGLGLRLLVIALQTAGSIAAQSTSLSHLLGPVGGDPMPAIGHILTVSALALLLATGFHTKLIGYFVISYDLLPALQFPSPSVIAEAGRGAVSRSFALAFSLAAPFVTVSVLYNLTLGVINKAMPQLMVAFVGAPVITLGAIVVLMLTAPAMLSAWVAVVEAFLASPYG